MKEFRYIPPGKVEHLRPEGWTACVDRRAIRAYFYAHKRHRREQNKSLKASNLPLMPYLDKEIADHLGIGTTRMSGIITGKRKPDSQIILKLASFYKVPAQEINEIYGVA